MTQQQIDRINELARKSRTPEGLTDAEKVEQKELRAAYVAAFKQSLVSQLDSTYIVRPDGTKEKLTKK
ncbi:MAG: DUF896 domain-containing protein [Clostridia bacterium]|nr:DUF896 domain-containing protein [Clostridia bacterium]MBR6779827.1 DUF896 domain-containing protein [Clostridia bacterium]